MNPIYFDGASEDTIVGLGIPFGGPGSKDLQGEWFDRQTDLVLSLVQGDRPLLYHHGLDPEVKSSVIGRITGYTIHETGVWWQAQLDLAGKYAATIKDLVRRGVLGFSSGALSHLVKREPDGRISVWPWIEGSLTATPANPLARAYSVKAADAAEHFAALNPYTAEARNELRLIRAHMAGIEPHRGLAAPGMEGSHIIQSEAPLHMATSTTSQRSN